MRTGKPTQGGFTLTEILIATGIFAFAVTGLIALFPTAQRVSREGEEEARAAMIAGDILDALDVQSSDGCFTVATGISGGALKMEQLDPRTATSCCVIYGASCEPIASLEKDSVDRPVDNPQALDIATLRLEKKSSLPGLVVADLEITSPASAPASGRMTNHFERIYPLPMSHE
jgi:prepilin-type N-terminal cleavage/methylation domain-containing protein